LPAKSVNEIGLHRSVEGSEVHDPDPAGVRWLFLSDDHRCSSDA
jgi:hypothetical protein